MDGWRQGGKEAWVDGWEVRWVKDGWMEGGREAWMDGWVDDCMGGFLDWIDKGGGRQGWMSGLVKGWTRVMMR